LPFITLSKSSCESEASITCRELLRNLLHVPKRLIQNVWGDLLHQVGLGHFDTPKFL